MTLACQSAFQNVTETRKTKVVQKHRLGEVEKYVTFQLTTFFKIQRSKILKIQLCFLKLQLEWQWSFRDKVQ